MTKQFYPELSYAHLENPCALGIDPGFDGALAFLNLHQGKLESLEDMPCCTIGRGRSARRSLDLDALTFLFELSAPCVSFCILEQVTAAPKQGTASTFRFGEGYGILRGLLAAHRIPTLTVPPKVWKPSLGLLTATKRDSVALAAKHFPSHRDMFYGPKGGLRDGRAEAALLALFGVS